MLNFVHSMYLYASAYYAHSVYFCAVKFPRFEEFINATNPCEIPTRGLKIPIIVTLINPLGKGIQEPLFFPVSNRRPKLFLLLRVKQHPPRQAASLAALFPLLGRGVLSSHDETERERERGRFSIRLLFVFFPLLPSFR